MLLEAGKYVYFNFSTSNVHEAMFFFTSIHSRILKRYVLKASTDKMDNNYLWFQPQIRLTSETQTANIVFFYFFIFNQNW